MIKCHLSTLMGREKMKIIDVANAIDENRSTITKLYKENAVRVDLPVLDKLCKLFKCEVGELLEYFPDE
jgi:putative transcriptional regulator